MSKLQNGVLIMAAALSVTGCATVWEEQHDEDMAAMRAMLARDDLSGAIERYGNSAGGDAGRSAEKIALLCSYVRANDLETQYPGLGC